MKIYFIGQKGAPVKSGGIERHVSELAPRLVNAGWDVFVYCRNWYTPKTLKTYKAVKLIHLPSLKTKHLDAISHTFLAVLDVLRRDADIIHFQGIGPSILSIIPRIFKPKARIIATFHCKDYLHQKWGLFARLFLKFSEFVTCKVPHDLIVSSKYNQKEVLAKYHKNAHVLYNGGDFGQTQKPELITQKFGLQGNDYIVSISRLVKHKGIHNIIRAYAGLKTDLKLVIVGEDAFTSEYEAYLKNLAGDDSRIIFTGKQEGKTLEELYSNAKMFIHASKSEGFSMALLEAMSYGRAVVYSDIEENIEAIGDTGLRFKNKSISDLKDKIQYLIDNPTVIDQLGYKAKARVEENFTWDKVAEALSGIYHSSLLDRDAHKLKALLENK